MRATGELCRDRGVFVSIEEGGLHVATWSTVSQHGSWAAEGCQVATEISCRDRVGCKVRGSRVMTEISGRDRVDCL